MCRPFYDDFFSVDYTWSESTRSPLDSMLSLLLPIAEICRHNIFLSPERRTGELYCRQEFRAPSASVHPSNSQLNHPPPTPSIQLMAKSDVKEASSATTTTASANLVVWGEISLLRVRRGRRSKHSRNTQKNHNIYKSINEKYIDTCIQKNVPNKCGHPDGRTFVEYFSGSCIKSANTIM